MKLLQLNCNGLKSRKEELQNLIKEENPDILCLQETRIEETNIKINRIYDVYIQPNKLNKNAGGAAIFVRKDVPHKKLT